MVYSGEFSSTARRCSRFSLIPPPNPAMPWSYWVTSGGHTLVRATLRGSQTASVSAPLLPQASAQGPSAKLTVYAKAQPVVIKGVAIGVKLAFFTVVACPVNRG